VEMSTKAIGEMVKEADLALINRILDKFMKESSKVIKGME